MAKQLKIGNVRCCLTFKLSNIWRRFFFESDFSTQKWRKMSDGALEQPLVQRSTPEKVIETGGMLC